MTSVTPVAAARLERAQPTVETQGTRQIQRVDVVPAITLQGPLPHPAETATEPLPCTFDRDPFYPDDDDVHGPEQIQNAKGICRGCPELSTCLRWAIAYEPWGVWAATTPTERGWVSPAAGRLEVAS